MFCNAYNSHQLILLLTLISPRRLLYIPYVSDEECNYLTQVLRNEGLVSERFGVQWMRVDIPLTWVLVFTVNCSFTNI